MGSKTRILERKLEELESELGVHNAGTDAGDFDQRCTFLNKILAAEVLSLPGNSDQFHEIAGRIDAVKAAFRDRNHINPSFSYLEDSVSDCLHNLQNEDPKELSSPDSIVEESADTAESKRPRRRRFEKYSAVFSCGVMIGAFLGLQLLSPIYDHFSVFPDDPLLLPPLLSNHQREEGMPEAFAR